MWFHLFSVFTYIYPLLINKDLFECQNISISFPCVLLYVSFILKTSSFFDKSYPPLLLFWCYPVLVNIVSVLGFFPFYLCECINICVYHLTGHSETTSGHDRVERRAGFILWRPSLQWSGWCNAWTWLANWCHNQWTECKLWWSTIMFKDLINMH